MALAHGGERAPVEGVVFSVISSDQGKPRNVLALVYVESGIPRIPCTNLPPGVISTGIWPNRNPDTFRPEIGFGYIGPEDVIRGYLDEYYTIHPDRIRIMDFTPK